MTDAAHGLAKCFDNRSVMVTGGAGFIGSHLAVALASAGGRVAVFDNLQAGRWDNLATAGERIRRIEGDMRDAAAVESALRATLPEVVFHLAANASVPASVTDPRYDFESNCAGSFVLFDALRRIAPTTRVVLASSAAVYGEPTAFPLTETSPLAPISPYGASKLAAEVEARVFHHIYELPVVIGRIFNTYGPGMPRFVVLDFLKKLRANPDELEIMGDGTQLRDFNYVSDTVEALLILAQRGEPGAAYNIASGVSHTVTDLARLLLDLRGLSGRTQLRFTGASWAGDAQRWAVDVGRLKRLGYEPRVVLREGVARVMAWFDSLDRRG